MHAVTVLNEGEIDSNGAPELDGTTGCLDELVRTLLTKAGRSGPDDKEGQEIILDANVDGSRYLLVRVPHSKNPAHLLSPREQEIVRMVSQGFPNKVIAGVLNISAWTVSTHVRRIFAKLGVTSRAQMVAQILEVQTKRDCGVREMKHESSMREQRKAG